MNSRPPQSSDHIHGCIHQRPLIERCTNEWQKNPRYRQAAEAEWIPNWFDGLHSFLERTWAVLKAPKFQRLIVLFVFATIVTILCWQGFLSVLVRENKSAWDAVNLASDKSRGNVFGANKPIHFPGLKQLSDLDPKYLPRTSSATTEGRRKDRRLIFIGDIHGCMDELQALLKKAKYNPDQDHIITTGDVINKGPKSKEVVDFLMAHNASCVRGNHEDKILLIAKQNKATPQISDPAVSESQNAVNESKAAKKSRKEHALTKSLSQKQLDWLSACPVVLRVGEVGKLGELVVVHGGLVPGIPLEDQDPMSVMNMRIIDLATYMPSKKHFQQGSIGWAGFWNKYQRLLPAQRALYGRKSTSGPLHTTVVYGHDSKLGLQIRKYTKGLDSGCVNGNELTAWIVGDFGENKLVQVKYGEHQEAENL